MYISDAYGFHIHSLVTISAVIVNTFVEIHVMYLFVYGPSNFRSGLHGIYLPKIGLVIVGPFTPYMYSPFP